MLYLLMFYLPGIACILLMPDLRKGFPELFDEFFTEFSNQHGVTQKLKMIVAFLVILLVVMIIPVLLFIWYIDNSRKRPRISVKRNIPPVAAKIPDLSSICYN
jgi:hypothetical protein